MPNLPNRLVKCAWTAYSCQCGRWPPISRTDAGGWKTLCISNGRHSAMSTCRSRLVRCSGGAASTSVVRRWLSKRRETEVIVLPTLISSRSAHPSAPAQLPRSADCRCVNRHLVRAIRNRRARGRGASGHCTVREGNVDGFWGSEPRDALSVSVTASSFHRPIQSSTSGIVTSAQTMAALSAHRAGSRFCHTECAFDFRICPEVRCADHEAIKPHDAASHHVRSHRFVCVASTRPTCRERRTIR